MWAFGSALVGADGTVRAEDRSQIAVTGEATGHPENAPAQWAAARLSAPEREVAPAFAPGEHFPVNEAVHG